MYRKILCCLLSFIVLVVPVTAYAGYISARSYAVLDGRTGELLLERNAHRQMPMASTTKIMTCLLACESVRLDETVIITQEMLDGTYGSLIYLAVGDSITLYDLVVGAMLASGNDAANSIAVYIGGSVDAFLDMMNTRAEQIGMTNTLFVTPSGLDEGGHHSSAYDMALLGRTAVQNEIFASVCSMQKSDIMINGKKQTVYNHNKLLSDDSFVGIKTGYTDRAGRCLVTAYEHNDNYIIAVTLGAPDDWNDHRKLIKSAIGKYRTTAIDEHLTIDAVGGTENTVSCSVKTEVTVCGDFEIKYYYYPFCYAPVHSGDKVGTADIVCNDDVIKTVEIIATEDVQLWQITK